MFTFFSKQWKHYCLLSLFLFNHPVSALTTNEILVEKKNDRFDMYAEFLLEADMKVIRQIMSDYENLEQINPYLIESKLLAENNDGSKQISMLTKACIMMICYKMRHVQKFTQLDDGTIIANFIPDLSDFNYGWSRWTFRKANDDEGVPATSVIIELEVEPDFFIVPIIGTELLKRKLIEITTVTMEKLEAKALTVTPVVR